MPEPDKSIGRKILSFFVKEEEPDIARGTAPAPTAATPRPVPTTPEQPDTPTQPVASSAASGTIDPKFAEHFANVLAQNNPPGPDYFEFRETLRSLGNLGLSEDKQFQAAWASFKALGGSGEVTALTNTANNYIAALTKDRDGFSKSVQTALAERVGSLQTEQKRLQSDNETLAKQLVEIQKQLDANKSRLAAIDDEVHEQTARITQNQQNYESTFAHFTNQIKADMAKMTQYLK